MAMLWHPQYTISNKLLLTIRAIGESVGEIKALCLTDSALAELELSARSINLYHVSRFSLFGDILIYIYQLE